MQRIAIIGSGGAGKSTFARSLGSILPLPVIHLDKLFWKPDWTPTPEQEMDRLMEELVAGEQWIIDGNYGRTMDIRLQAADTIIFLDYPTRVSLFRALKRRVRYHAATRPDMGEGCPEKIDWQFIQWILHYRRDKRPAVMQKLESYKSSKQILIFHSPKQLKQFLKQLEHSRH